MREKLKLHCDVISGYAFSSSDWKEDGVPVIKIGNISNGGDVDCNEQLQHVDELFLSTIDSKYQVAVGDILVSLTGSHINQPNSMVGRSCRNLTEQKYLLNQRAGKVIPFDNTDRDYLYYLISTRAIKYDIANRAYGGANQVNVSPTDIKNIKWDFPLIEKQKKISGILLKYDELILNNKKRILQLESIAQELYQEWFVRFRFPGYENVKFENGLPVTWEVKKVKEIVKRKPFGKLYKESDLLMDGNVIVIDQSRNDYIGFHDNEPSHVASVDNPIALFGDHSCKYKLMITPFSLSENVVPFIGGKGILTMYLFYLLNGQVETTEYKRHWTELMSKKVLVADFKLQQLFVDYVSNILLMAETLSKNNRNLINQRDMLLLRLMSGKLEV